MNPRLRDGLLGAAVAVLVLVLAVGIFVWSISDPAGGGAAASSAPVPGPSTGGTVAPPSDLDPAEMWLDDLVLDAGLVVLPDSTLRDVTVTAQGARTGPDGLVATAMVVDATVPFEVVAAQIGQDAVVRSGGASVAVVERTVEIAGRSFDVVASGEVDVVGGRLVVEPTTIDIGGPSFLAGLIGSVVRGLVTIEHEVEGLPEGLVLQDVDVRDDGFRAHLRGDDVRIVFPAAS
ncbi:LmeA family phospholipid-binding protein [uncultured Cellulomonas sp.]|uniref:LmeA family phospholipid-binding protein n=1 Tax=uncultured Cellulomonas sp. TaxID=189682 RepID=UPI0028E69A7C|nr:LmeA family phospholipid-binding protein [uncultured Cellulomonas sp.]